MRARTFLVVEHDRLARDVLGKAIRDYGHKTHLAASGEEACDILREHHVDAVLMALAMPAMSGQTLYHVIISRWPELRSRILVMTGDPAAERHAPWLRLYALPVIRKPPNLRETVALLEEISSVEPLEANGER